VVAVAALAAVLATIFGLNPCALKMPRKASPIV
jgi:hypothetical protein